VQVRGGPSTLHVTEMRDSTLLVGPTATSVFLEGCSGCLVAVSCQQMRIHSTSDTSVYLHTTARAVIEDCNTMRFAPYTWTYPGIEQDYLSTGLDRAVNNWRQVGDFNWLATDVPSPHWSLLEEGERRSLGEGGS